MFLIFGFGKQTFREYGKTEEQACGHCNKTAAQVLVKVTSWFTLFFIPLIPYSMKYVLICPLCDGYREVPKEELEDILGGLRPMGEPGAGGPEYGRIDGGGLPGRNDAGGDEYADLPDISEPDRYAGKNPTQVAYLEKIAAHEREKDLDAREKAVEARERAVEAREKDLEARDK